MGEGKVNLTQGCRMKLRMEDAEQGLPTFQSNLDIRKCHFSSPSRMSRQPQ